MKKDENRKTNKRGFHYTAKLYGDNVLVIKTGNTVVVKNLVNNGKKLVVSKREYEFGVAKCNVGAGDVFNLQFGKKLAYERMKRKQLRKEIRDDRNKLKNIEKELSQMTRFGLKVPKRLSSRIHMGV